MTCVTAFTAAAADGDLDTSFGSAADGAGASGEVFDSVIKADGKIAIVGFISSYDSVSRNRVAQTNPDGTVDATFNPAPLYLDYAGSYYAIAAQPDGKVLVGGHFFSGPVELPKTSGLTRLNADGSIDSSFDPHYFEAVGAILVQPDGKILVGGFTTINQGGTTIAPAILRLNPDGSLDQSFSPISMESSGLFVTSITLQPDGKIVIGGGFDRLDGVDRRNVARLNANGTLDVSFNSSVGADRFVYASVVQGDGKIVIGGAFKTYNGVEQARLARLNSDGSLDPSFTSGLSAGETDVYSLALGADGKILVAGRFSQYGGFTRQALVRTNSDGSIDQTFISGVDLFRHVQTVNLQPDGKIIIGGNFTRYQEIQRNYLARVLWTSSTAPTPSATPTPTATPKQTVLGNIATRLRVETGENVLIAGFIVTGDQPKKVMLRAIGTSLQLDGKLQDPVLELYDSAGELIRANDNWQDALNRQEITDSTIAPNHELESAILMTLPAGGNSYTAVVRGANGGTGVGVVEGYDLDQGANSKAANISTRGRVQTGEDVMIGGFFVLNGSQKVIVRAIGPSLPVDGKLADPTLDLINSNGDSIAFNNNWRDSQQEQIELTTIPPTNQFESAIVATLPAGSYTAVVRGASNNTGVGLVEVYALD